MNAKTTFLIACLVSVLAAPILGQGGGSISGSVVDSAGAMVRNANVIAKGTGGQEYKASTGESGYFVIPAVQSGVYSVSASAQGFKTTITYGIKVDVGGPSRAELMLEAGEVSEVVEVVAGEEPIQSQTATVSSTISFRQVSEIPSVTRDVLQNVTLVPGITTIGRTRTSTANGLPKSAIAITLDGVDVQDNSNRSWDGFFAFVRPRTDAVEEVVVTTSAPGADSNGEGAVRIALVTRRGTDSYRGGLFWQHRNTALNSNYWYNNRDLAPDPETGKAPRNRMLLNQYGGNFGGPLPYPNFGTGGPLFRSGKDRTYFFVNYEEFRLPLSISRSRIVLTPEARNGLFSYNAGGQVRTVDLYQLAAANGQLATPDPTIGTLLTKVETAAISAGTLTAITNDPNRNFANFFNSAIDIRKFLTMRFDVKINDDHSVEAVFNRQKLYPTADYTRGRDPSFPGFPGYGFGSDPQSNSLALRSNFGGRFVNEVRYGEAAGEQKIGTITQEDFSASGGFNLDMSAAGVTSPYSPFNSGFAKISEPVIEITDNATLLAGSHTIGFGGQFKFLRSIDSTVFWVVPVIRFGVDPAETTAFAMFNGTTMPGSTPAQQDEARRLYATLVGRVQVFDQGAYLDEQGVYRENGALTRRLSLKTYGLYAQDYWKIRSDLVLSFGIRWQPQEGFVLKTANAGKLEDPNMVWGISGPGNAFRPGVFEGQTPRVVLYDVGDKIYPDDLNNFAPSVGVAWSPNIKGSLGKLLGAGGRSVIRAGFSRSFMREGSNQQMTPIRNNPGGGIDVSRATYLGNLTPGTNLRDPSNPNLTAAPFSETPDVLPTPVVVFGVDPEIQTGYVDSFSVGYQRQIGGDSAIEIRYSGNRGRKIRRTNFLNETNTIENGFADEFLLAQANLYANLAAGRGATFAYFGEGSGTSPLPIMLAYFNQPALYNPLDPARYSPANFANSSLVSTLSVNANNIHGFTNNRAFEQDLGRRANAIANGLPANFFRVNPDVFRLSNQLSDDASSWYDSLVVEFRRRLARGLRVQASYVFAKALSNAYSSSESQRSDYTLREGGLRLAKNFSPYDIRHQFKFDATYDLPLGRGREYFSGASRFTDLLIGGWSVIPVVRWQSGAPFQLGNVQLVGMTKKELQSEIKVRKGPNSVTFLPADIILNTLRAYNISVASPTGYGTTYGGPPEGRFIAPAGYGNCLSRFPGECGFANLILHGPDFFKFDAAILKRFRIDEKRNVEFRVVAFDVLNRPPFRMGGWDPDITGTFPGGSQFGQLPSGSAYQDLADSQYPGGRVIDLMLRLNF